MSILTNIPLTVLILTVMVIFVCKFVFSNEGTSSALMLLMGFPLIFILGLFAASAVIQLNGAKNFEGMAPIFYIGFLVPYYVVVLIAMVAKMVRGK